ncbi:zinc finger protein, putative [Pediculus humanus corporis]|uniref:Zinc finger protein, putative n=1 Tax=Pediculus humanus subsp. corporis TaxID=121224 RepID=E0VGY1_PEDHC|nr:zinc finger protein, putative [Pediculus humanus corporis]EEB12637.1 zinc finger protein, putative [Pediculus humanus corporis]
MLQTVLTVKDFNSVCRICLQCQKDMIDIFSTGFHKQFIKITKIEVKCDDNLPKKICQNCLTQMKHLSEFLEKVKSSDAYLHLLLSCDQDLNGKEKGKKSYCRSKIKTKKIKSKRFLKNSKIVKEKELDVDKNKYYVIFVPDSDKDKKLDAEICIKDISLNENENSELLHFCKSLINDHSKVKLRQKLPETGENEEENKKINEIKKCKNSYEEMKDLNNHYLIHHSHVTINNKFYYECPVCKFKGDKKFEFLNHLTKHSEEVDSVGEPLELNEEEDEKIFVSFTEAVTLMSILNNSSKIYEIENVYSCEESQFKIDSLLEEHYEEEPPNSLVEKSLNKICPVCKMEISFDKINDDVVDIDEDEEGKKNMIFICEKCEMKCLGIENYKKHYSSCKGQNLYKKLEICQVFQGDSLKIHCKRQTLRMENFIKCEICNRKFIRQASFDRHKSAHLNPRYFDCDICKLPLPSKTSLQKHSELHKINVSNFKCKTCKANFTSRDSLTTHQSSAGHNVSRQRELECNVCGEKFLIGKKFTEHIKMHPKYKMGECGLCGKRLSTFQSLMFHMQRHFKSNSILCPHCGKQFFEEKNYNRHLLTHEGIKPYSCDIQGCEKSFYTFFELNRHKKYHNNTRDFVCPHCAKSFHEANHLTVHVRIHTGERPYTCPHCKRGFITRTRCKHHIKLVHQGIGYDQIQSRISKKVAIFETLDGN